MCGGFTCSKNALTALNILYIVVASILIGVAAYGRATSIVTSAAILGGIIACGVFLMLLSILGLVGARKHHQVMLFFYMVIMFILFVVQFAVACACLAFSREQISELAKTGWDEASPDLKAQAEKYFHCCGFYNHTDSGECTVCTASDAYCPVCSTPIQNAIENTLKLSGGVGLFFSFTEFIGVWLTVRYRNQKDSRTNPSAFL